MANEVSKRPAPQLPGLATAADAARIVVSIPWENDGRTVRLGRYPAPDERRALQERNLQVTSLLRPSRLAMAEQATACGELGMLFKQYPSLRKADIPDMIQTYWENLKDFPIGAIVAAVEAVKKNQIGDLDPDWPPSSPRLVKVAKEYVSRLAVEQHAIDRILAARELMRPLVSAADAALVASRLTELAATMKANNVTDDLSTREERESRNSRSRDASQREILAEYASLGLEPIYGLGGVVSVALARQMGKIAGRMPRRDQVPLEAYGDNLDDRDHG